MYKNNKIGLIEKFIKIENKIHVIIRVVTIKNKQKNPTVDKALLNINKFIFYCNLTDNFCLIPIENLKEKVIICETTNFPKAKYYVTPMVVCHN